MTKTDDKIKSLIDAALEERGLKGGTAVGMKKCGEGVYLVAYESRNPSMVFVPDPCKRGRFCRVPRNFLYRGCVSCGALPGQPCHNNRSTGSSWSGQTGHADRGGHAQNAVPQSFYDDVVQEQALIAFAKLATSRGIKITVDHHVDCPRYRPSGRKPCDCGFEDREKLLARVIRQLPDMKDVDDVTTRR